MFTCGWLHRKSERVWRRGGGMIVKFTNKVTNRVELLKVKRIQYTMHIDIFLQTNSYIQRHKKGQAITQSSWRANCLKSSRDSLLISSTSPVSRSGLDKSLISALTGMTGLKVHTGSAFCPLWRTRDLQAAGPPSSSLTALLRMMSSRSSRLLNLRGGDELGSKILMVLSMPLHATTGRYGWVCMTLT